MLLKGSGFLVSNRYKPGKRCSSACLTKNHRTFGECMKAKNLNLSPHVSDAYSVGQKAWDRELHEYREARRQGVQPAGTTTAKVRQAMEASEKTGEAFQAA